MPRQKNLRMLDITLRISVYHTGVSLAYGVFYIFTDMSSSVCDLPASAATLNRTMVLGYETRDPVQVMATTMVGDQRGVHGPPARKH